MLKAVTIAKRLELKFETSNYKWVPK